MVPTSAEPMRPPRTSRRLVDLAHRLDNPENGRDDADGREGVAHGGERLVGLHLVARDRLDFFVHQRLDLVGASIADDDEANIVADEGRQFLVGKNRRGRLEDRRFIRIVDMGFDLVARLGAQIPHQAVEHAERIEIVALAQEPCA